tara:strand:- start:2615 stop:4477 length:1863 start_codon:yes stop_codon:yes gene_type:complete
LLVLCLAQYQQVLGVAGLATCERERWPRLFHRSIAGFVRHDAMVGASMPRVIKGFSSQLAALIKDRTNRRNLGLLARFLLVLLMLIVAYSVLFHVLMLREGQEHTWLTGLYWTLTVMSTLGFGDITFDTDLGRVFSMIVLLTGMVFLLILLPWTFIEFFYEPWMKAQADARTPRGVPADMSNHFILTQGDPLTRALVRRLEARNTPHVVITSDSEMAMRLQDDGFRVAVGHLDDPETYRRCGGDRAAAVVATGSDISNTSAAFAAREVNRSLAIVCTAQRKDSIDVLELAGATHVLRLEKTMGESFARRTLGGETSTNVIGHVDGVLIAEAAAAGTPLVGKTLGEVRMRQDLGIAVAGIWSRGTFLAANADSKLEAHHVLVLAGTKETLLSYDDKFGEFSQKDAPVLILGGGRVGLATAQALGAAGFDYRIVERDTSAIGNDQRTILGDAADLAVLQQAGLNDTQTIIITTHQDDVNAYLTIYCRKLRPDVQILARCTTERSIATLHRAGADNVLSYASMGTNVILNHLKHDRMLMVAEGLDVFRVAVPKLLAGKKVGDCGIRQATGCSIVAIGTKGAMKIVPGPEESLQAGHELLLIGTIEAQRGFFGLYPDEQNAHHA